MPSDHRVEPSRKHEVSRLNYGRYVQTAGELLASVATATVLVALLQHTAPVAGLEMVYLPVVVVIAIRRGQWAAYLSALLSVLSINFFFLTPREQLSIAHSQDVVALVVFAVVGAIVSQLAASARRSADAAAVARRSDEVRTAVLHAISHDLRTPLTAITTAGSALRRGGLSAQDRDALTEVIDSEGRRLAELVEDLLDLSKIEAGAATPVADWVDLGDVAVAALDDVGEDAARVELRIGTSLPLVRADSTQLERAVANLLGNALKHSDSTVVLSGSVNGDTVALEVMNRGEGIASDERDLIFNPFYRGRNRRGSGSGLGLAISRGFVEANGGRLILRQSAGVTVFVVRLPAAPVSGEPVPA